MPLRAFSQIVSETCDMGREGSAPGPVAPKNQVLSEGPVSPPRPDRRKGRSEPTMKNDAAIPERGEGHPPETRPGEPGEVSRAGTGAPDPRSRMAGMGDVLSRLGELPAGTLYLKLKAGPVILRNVPITLWRGEAGKAAGEPALKLVFEDESSLNLSKVKDAHMDAGGRVVVTCEGAEITFGMRPW